MIELIDSHAHLYHGKLSQRLDEVVENARAAGVVQIVTLGTTAANSAESLRMASDRAGIFVAVGIHPNDWAAAEPGDWERILQLAGDPNAVAIGETGLDRHWNDTPFDQQKLAFDLHLDLAEALHKPVSIHCRECEAELIDHLRSRNRPVQGVLHSFCGSVADAEAFLDLGLYLSFAGMLTFTNKTLDPLREAAKRAPADRILVETDSPYLSPHPFRGKQNEPARVGLTAAKLAEVRGVSFIEIARVTTANARRLFSLPEHEVL